MTLFIWWALVTTNEFERLAGCCEILPGGHRNESMWDHVAARCQRPHNLRQRTRVHDLVGLGIQKGLYLRPGRYVKGCLFATCVCGSECVGLYVLHVHILRGGKTCT